MSIDEKVPIAGQTNKFDLPADLQDTAVLLERLLGKAVSDRYIDFCRLSAGAFDLRVPSPLAGHALRELDSILRQMLAVPFDAIAPQSEGEEARGETAANILKGLGYDDEQINRAKEALEPRSSHKNQILKIVARLGLAEDGDVALAWISISLANKKAHERSTNRSLKVDDEFRERWAAPFHMVVRAIAVELQGKYTTLVARVDELAAITDKEKALSLYEKEIPGALSLQWRFFQKIDGPGWLPELLKRGLIAEPLPYSAETSKELNLRQWPLGHYLFKLAKSDDKATHALVIYALRFLGSSKHPDVRRDGLEILEALPASEVAAAADLVSGWLNEDAFSSGAHIAEKILAKLAGAGEKKACLDIAKSLYRLFDSNDGISTTFMAQMYEHSIFNITPTLTCALGAEALMLFCDLLYQAAVITKKIRTDPPSDYTSFSSLPLPQTERDQYDVYGALTCAVLRCASQLIEDEKIDGAAVIVTLCARPYSIYQRIALHILSMRPLAAPQMADALLTNADLVENESLVQEYAKLARIWFPSMDAVKQNELLSVIDAVPTKYLNGWRNRFTEHSKRSPTAEEEQDFSDLVICDMTYHWREALPVDRQQALAAFVLKHGDPDARRNSFGGALEESPLTSADFDATEVKDIANYLKSWTPNEELAKKTKTALAFALRKAVQDRPLKFSTDALAFTGLAPIYIRQLFEGLHQAVQNNAVIEWAPILELIEAIIPTTTQPAPGMVCETGDDPSPFWVVKEAVGLIRACLQRGEDIISLNHADRLKSIICLVEKIVPDKPELADFEERYTRHAYFAAEATMAGLTAELNVLFIYWLSTQEQTSNFEPLINTSFIPVMFSQFAKRALDQKNENGRIVRAVFGRYLTWLIHFDADWVRANFTKIFPRAKALREASWLGHLLSDNRPARHFVKLMRPLYKNEFTRLNDNSAMEDRDFRQNRCGEYVIVLYLWGVLPNDMLDDFLQAASSRLRHHVMWFIGRELKISDLPEDVRARALDYWETRLATAIESSNKDDFREELRVISIWGSFGTLDPVWLIAQQLKMFKAGFTSNGAYSIVDWASKVATNHPDSIVEMIEALITNPMTDQWAYKANHKAVRTILTAGLTSENADTLMRVEKIINYLASIGEFEFVDLIQN